MILSNLPEIVWEWLQMETRAMASYVPQVLVLLGVYRYSHRLLSKYVVRILMTHSHKLAWEWLFLFKYKLSIVIITEI
jgi:hypothetical protein